ncbi:hypothetical protein CEQ90_11655 [Lewinellaceae bacterium SD302]|nr:hypothetical protein CEQ90_11655 [Lewinellaceae bacterium SD302]
MKKAIPYLLLFGLLYGAWWYWQQRPRPPLRAQLLPYAATDIDRIFLWPAGSDEETGFELARVDEDNWVVENNQRSLNGQGRKAEQLLSALLAIKSQGLVPPEMVGGRPLLRLKLQSSSIGNISEELIFYPAPDSLPGNTLLLRLNGLTDVYRIDEFSLRKLPTEFDDYRNPLLADLSVLGQLDSLVWWRANDSIRFRLLDRPAGDSLVLDSLQGVWSPRLENKYADHFGEIRDQTYLEGRYLLFGAGSSDSLAISLYANERWPLPYVVRGNGTEYFALEKVLWETVD